MIAGLIFFLLTASNNSSKEPANWACAIPLIQKNYMQKIDTRQLALRITDECANPFVWISDSTFDDSTLRIMNENTYRIKLELFSKDIEAQIYKARRKDEIQLKR
jgi:hypothetical protein